MSTSSSALAAYAQAVAALLQKPENATSYSYDKLPATQDSAPILKLDGNGQQYAYTDCSGWVAFALNSLLPVHQAVVEEAKRAPALNPGLVQTYPAHGGTPVPVTIKEAGWAWARADVLTDLFGTSTDGARGFSRLDRLADVGAGDLIAYATGIYTDPGNPAAATTPGLVDTGDSGHTMVVIGAPQLVDPSLVTIGRKVVDGRVTTALVQDGVTYSGTRVADTLSPDAVAVYAVPVVDSSSVPHFGVIPGLAAPVADSRSYGHPTTLADGTQIQGGGLGAGTLWFAVDMRGQAIQLRFSASDAFQPPANAGQGAAAIKVAAARVNDAVALDPGLLTVNVYPNAVSVLNGRSYAVAEAVTGPGGLRVTGGGTLGLSAGNSYSGGTVIENGTLHLAASDAAGTGAIQFTAGQAGVLRLDAGVEPANPIVGFGKGHAIELAGVNYVHGMTVRVDGSTIELRGADGASLTTLTFGDAAGAHYAAGQFGLERQAAAGTKLSLIDADRHFAFETPDAFGARTGDAYAGPVHYLDWQYIMPSDNGGVVAAGVSNVFLKGGAGADALAAISGSNVLDGGGGSNFLVGATGTDGGRDTFFVDATRGGTNWDTVVNFHAGDMVTIWNLTAIHKLDWEANRGAAGYTGATVHITPAGGTAPTMSVTFAGIGLSDAQSKFMLSSGTIGGLTYGAITYTPGVRDWIVPTGAADGVGLAG